MPPVTATAPTLPQHASPLAGNPAGWPDELLPVFANAITAEYASLTRAGAPITVPLTPYVGRDGLTLDVTTGVTYPVKAERARREPKVALLYADAAGSGLEDPPVVLVQGLAAVRDADLQRNTDRYVREAMQKLPNVYKGQPGFLLRRLGWYFARMYIQVTPVRILWWPRGRLDAEPEVWEAPDGGAGAPASDPVPPGRPPKLRSEQAADWRTVGRRLAEFDQRDVTVVGEDGFPFCLPAEGVSMAGDRLELRASRGLGGGHAAAPACVTLHRHDESFTFQENHALMGRLAQAEDDGGRAFAVERAIGTWSIPQGKLTGTADFMRKGRELKPHLKAEAQRRGQPVPRVNLPPRA